MPLLPEDELVSGGTVSLRKLVTPKMRAVISVGLFMAIPALLAWRSDTTVLRTTLSALDSQLLLIVLVALTGSALLAAGRLKFVASDLGYDIGWRGAVAGMSVGQIGGAAFFQIAGQIMGRGAYLSRHGVPVDATVLMVGYERLAALAISLTAALAGGWYIFGSIALDVERGGDELLKLMAGLLAAIAAGGAIGWGRKAFSAVRQLPGATMLHRSLRTLLITIGVHALTLTSYVVIASTLSANTPVGDLVAASAVVMFAASLPISFAGWGVREISSIFALGAVGVEPTVALVTAVLIGIGSLSVVAILAGLSLAHANSRIPSVAPAPSPTIDYTRLLSITVPLAVATLIFFQVHAPVGVGRLNVNLADPLAILGGAFFVVTSAVYLRRWPVWRIGWMNAHLLGATAVITVSLLIGAWRFGWTDWAVTNKFLGWFVLLGYATVGALIVRSEGEDGLRALLTTFAAGGSAIASLDFLLVLARACGLEVPGTLLTSQMTGFADNPNAFAFQMLMVFAAAVAVPLARTTSIVILTLATVGIWFSISRAALLTLPLLIVIAVYMRALTGRQVAVVLAAATAVVLAIMAINLVAFGDANAGLAPLKPPVYKTDASTAEHMQSILGGLELFLSHPIFGAGLGAYIETHMRAFGKLLVIHSTPIWVLAEMGIAGFLVLAAPVMRVFFVEVRRTEQDPAGVLLILIITALAAMSLVHELLYQRTFWLLFGAALACSPSRDRPT